AGRVGLGLLEAVSARVCARPEPDLQGLVALLSGELGASSMCIFEARKGDPVAIATSGVLPDLSRHRRFVELLRGAAASGHAVRATSLEGDVPLTCAIGAGAGPDRLGVVVAGDLKGRGREVAAVLRVLVVLCQRLRPEALAPAVSPSAVASSSSPKAARCSWTRSATCHSSCRPSCCARCRRKRYSPWAGRPWR